MPWCGCLFGRETNVPSSPRSVWLWVFVNILIIKRLRVWVFARATLTKQMIKVTAVHNTSLLCRWSNHLPIWEWNQISKSSWKDNDFRLFTLYKAVCHLLLLWFQKCKCWNISLLVKRLKILSPRLIDCYSFRIWSIFWRLSPWRISFLTGACFTKGNWCS